MSSQIYKVYSAIGRENILFESPQPFNFQDIQDKLGDFSIAYVGKHKAIPPGDASAPKEGDFDLDLLIECRLFKADTEIFIYPYQGDVVQRTITSGSGHGHEFIEKKVQLRNFDGVDTINRNLVLRHYIDEMTGGYSILRYCRIEKSKP